MNTTTTPWMPPLKESLARFAELCREPLQLVLNASGWRVRWLGFFSFVGNLFFYWLLAHHIPQNFESLTLRLICSGLGLVALIKNREIIEGNKKWQLFYCIAIFIQLPLFFFTTAVLNNLDALQLGACCAMVFIYYQGTDWRIATAGLSIGILYAFVLNYLFPSEYSYEALVIFFTIFGFSWICAVAIAISAADILKQNMLNTAYSLGVMAHELRTPISSISILNTVLRNKNNHYQDAELSALSNKLDNLVKTINNHIDNQISNSKIIEIKPSEEQVEFAVLIKQTVAAFPFLNEQERGVVYLDQITPLQLRGSSVLFTQVINNLIRNSFKALARKEMPINEQRITVRTHIEPKPLGGHMGVITVSDNGVGIKTEDLSKVLEPFYSTDQAIGHGLGLTFCKKVVTAYRGKLLIHSTYGVGTTITIYLPLAQ